MPGGGREGLARLRIVGAVIMAAEEGGGRGVITMILLESRRLGASALGVTSLEAHQHGG